VARGVQLAPRHKGRAAGRGAEPQAREERGRVAQHDERDLRVDERVDPRERAQDGQRPGNI